MSKKPPAMVDFKFSEDNIDETTGLQGVENPNFIYDDDDDRSNGGLKLELEDDILSDDDDQVLIKIQEKEKPQADDIFEDMSPKVKKVEAPNKVDKVKKPRKPMSEEHKQKLALAREKAMLVRKQKAIENKKMKALDIEEKELLKKQRVKKVQKLKEEVEQDDAVPIASAKETKIINTLTKKDLEDAQLEAIMKYDAMRKEAKKKKKEQQIIEEGKKRMLNHIQRATGNYSYRDGSNRFDQCY
jgi:hypothetical protein